MAAWQEKFKDKLITMEEAAWKIDSGDRLFVGETVAIPYNFLNELYKRNGEIQDVTIMYNFATGLFDMLFDEESKKSFRFMSWFTGPLDRMSGEMDILEFHSAPYEFFIKETMDVYDANTMVIEICPPDENGIANVAILSAPYFKSFKNHPKQFTKKIAVINKHQHPAQGADDIINVNVDWFDYLVEDHHEISFIPESGPTPVDEIIGDFVMEYVHDGDTIQIGKGGLGEQVTKRLHSKKNMRVFAEILGDSMIDLAASGAIDHITTAGCYGSAAIYEFTGTSPLVETKDLSQMLDPYIIGLNDNMVAINSTFMVDLLGQACSEAQGFNQYSSVGGAFGYMYGATRSKGGRSFLCLRSTYKKDGKLHSNVVAWLPEQSIITTPKYLSMYIVSEYGVADVYLRTNKDRIRALLPIAHPDFRAELKEQIISTGMIKAEDFAE